MLESKLAESVKTLTQAELSEFASFLDSRYFQREFSVAQLKQLYALIQKALFSGVDSQLSKQEAHRLIFESKPFAENRIDRIMFELNRLVKQFLLIKYYFREGNEVQVNLDWASVQRGRGLVSNLEKQIEKLKADIQNQQKTSAEKYHDHFRLAQEAYIRQVQFNRGKGDIGLQNAIESLDFYYYAQRLEMLMLLMLQQRMAAISPSELVKQTIDNFEVPAYFLERSEALFLTNELYLLLRTDQPDTAGFQRLLQLLKSHESHFSPPMLQQLYSYLRNYCVILIDSGRTEFEQILHEINVDNVERGYFYMDGKIHPNALLNITTLAIRVNKLAWARQFIQQHKDIIIGENETGDFYRMCEVLCLFSEKKFDTALQNIPFGSTYSAYHVLARILELKIYYELKSELLPSKIDAFKMYINRAGNKVYSKNWSELITNFGNFVHQFSLSIPGDKKRSELLIKRIQSKKHVAERTWLLEKARDLGVSKS